MVEEIFGDRTVEGVRINNVQNSNQKSEINCDGVFVAIGHKPNTEIFRNQRELDNKCYIKKYEGSRTSVEGVFVEGDVYDYVYRQAVTAAGSGCKERLMSLDMKENRTKRYKKWTDIYFILCYPAKISTIPKCFVFLLSPFN